MLLTATFRLLYSGEAGFDRKLDAAQQLVAALLGSGSPDAVAEAAALPPLVAAHYLRSLVEWSSSALIKGGGAEAGGKKGKKQQQSKQGADGEQRPARLEPRCWAVLASVLSSQGVPASQPLPAALLPAATAALQQAGQLPDSAQQAELLRQLAALLRLLAAKFGSSFRPRIEHAAAVAEAALAGEVAAHKAAADNTAAWEDAACAAVRLLAAAAAGHPNQRKVWDAAVPRLLPLLAGAAFPADGTAGGNQLGASCRQVLEVVLFNQQHVVPLATAAAAEFAAALAEAHVGGSGSGTAEAAAAEAAAAEQEGEETEGDDMEMDGAADASTAKQAKHSAADGYTAQLFAALRRHVAACEVPLELMPWMVGCFCAALKQHRRVAETEAELTSQADRRSKAQQQQEDEDGEEGGRGAGSSSQRKPAGGSGVSVSADFHFWLALLRTLTPHVQQQQQQGGAESELTHAVGGVALLAGALRQHQLYRPTQDPAGQQRLMLQQLADTALALAQQQRDGSSSGAAAPAGVVPAALGVVQGILAVEHRVIQQQLPLLWPLLLQSPQAAGVPADGSGSGDDGVAVAVACSLVAAFAELRQLEVLLRSLTDALLQPAFEASDAASGGAAAAVLGSRRFQAALSTAVQQLPSGQVPMLLRLVGKLAPRLGNAAPESSLLAADLCCCCLASLSIDLTTAAAAAGAAAALVAALAPLLLPLLSTAAAGDGSSGSSKKEKKQRKAQAQAQAQASLLPALLRLYRRALLVHGRCAGLHPQVAPLPGQHVQPTDGSSRAVGYFAPLLGDDSLAAPDLAALLGSPAASSRGGDLRQALLQAAEQRVAVLHQQQRYLTRTCPVTLLPEPGTEQAEQQAAQQAQQAQHAQQQLQAVEGELRTLAEVLGSAAAHAAATADGSTLEALQLAAGLLPVLQEWAPPAQLQQLLQACLRQAAAGGPSSPATQLCCSLLLSEDLLEQRQLAALLPAAAAAELGAALSTALGGAAGEAEESSAKKKRKKGQEGAADASNGHLSDHAATLLQQLGRLAKGKGVKSSSWAAAVQGSSAAIVAAAADLGSSRSSGGKKRKQQEGAAGGAGLEAVQRQLQLLAQLPLAHLQPEAAAGLTAVAVGSLVCCWEGSLTACKAGQPVSSALPASAACLQLLARLASGGTSSGLEGQQQLLPVVLQAALTAAMQAAAAGAAAAAADADAGSEGDDDALLRAVAATAEHSRCIMQALCAAQLAAADGSVQQTASQLSAQLQQQQGSQQWASAVLAQGCLAACATAAHDASRRAAADILCGSSSGQQQAAASVIGSTAAALESAVAAALPTAAEAAVGGSGQAQLLAGSLYSCAALLLRLRCCDHPAAEALEQAAAGGSSSVIGTMAAGFKSAAALLGRSAAGRQAAASALLVQPVLEYVAACCSVTGRMRPAASSSHYASLLALLLHLLAQQQVEGAVPPSRQTIPFAAAFPAAAAEASSAPRPLLLEALRELVAGSSSQQLLLPLRYAEAALPAAGSRSGGSSSSSTLPLCELLLVLLEAASGVQQQRLLAQHAERISGLLTRYISSAAYGSPQQGVQQPASQPLPGMQQLAAAILAAGEGGSAAGAASAGEEAPAAPATPPVPAAAAPAAAPPAAEVAALCTALRALESLAARPKLFQLSPAAVGGMVAGMEAVWAAYAEQPGAAAREAAALPGFCFRLDAGSGAGLFAGSCHLLLALLRHRQQELRRCLPLVLQALRALLRFLVAAELSDRLQQRVPERAAGDLGSAGRRAGQAAQERQWRIKCAELLASVLTELAGLKEAGVGRYCPHLLADYLVLTAAPPSGKSKALLRFASPARALVAAGAGASDAAAAVAAGSGAAGASTAAAAAAAEDEVLAGEPMSRKAAAALRQGAYALYGACSAAEIQFLYASLAGGGSGGARGSSGAVASWRAALAALKADFEKHHKYTGKV